MRIAPRLAALGPFLALLIVLVWVNGCSARIGEPRGARAGKTAAPPAPRPAAPAPPRRLPGPPRSLDMVVKFAGVPLMADSDVGVVAFSPDGKLLASGGGLENGANVLLWDATTGERVDELVGRDARITRLTFSPDGKTLAVTNMTASLTVWDIAARRVAKRLDTRTYVRALAYSPDGRFLAILEGASTVLLWDIEKGGEPRTLAKLSDLAPELVYSRDGHVIAAATWSKKLYFIKIGLGDSVREVAVEERIHSLTMARDGATLVTRETLKNGTEALVTRDAATGARKQTLADPRTATGAFAAGAEPGVAVTASGDGTARVWDLAAGQARAVFNAPNRPPLWSVDVSPDGGRAVTAGMGRAIRMFDMRTGAPILTQPQGHAQRINAIAYSPDGALLASGDEGGRVLVREARRGDVIKALPDQAGPISTLAFSPDGRRLLTRARDDVRFWDPRSGTEVARVSLAGLAVLAYSPDGRYLAASQGPDNVDLVDAESHRVLRTFRARRPEAPEEPVTVTSIAFSPDSKRLAVTRWDKGVQVFDVETGARGQVFPAVLQTVYSPDGRLLGGGTLSITRPGTHLTFTLWDVATGRDLRTIDSPTGFVAFSPKSDLLGTVRAGEVNLWDVASALLVVRGAAPAHRPLCLAFSPDGTHLATGGADASVVVWAVRR